MGTDISTTPSGLTPVTDLAAVMRGEIVAPADPGWDDARQAWNLAVDQHPALIGLPTHVLDVVALVDFANRYGLRVAVQATGHHAAAMPTLEDTVLLSTRRLRGVEIDPERCIARVQAGTRWGEVAAAATELGLFPLAASSSPHVGVVGDALGGGLSWLGRRHGLTANHVTAVEVVKPNGALVRATADQHPDLFWALRGGGGNFGVVTALELELLPYGSVYAGTFVWPYERHAEVAAAWYGTTRRAPDELTTSLRVLHMPPSDELPPVLAGRSVVVVDGAFAGDPAAGAAALTDLRRLAPELDTWAPTTPWALGHVHMAFDEPVPYASDAVLVDDMGIGGVRAVTSILRPGTPLLAGEIRHLGGALARMPSSDGGGGGGGGGATSVLPGEYLVVGLGIVTGPETSVAVEAALHDIRDEMVAYDTGRAVANFTHRPLDPAALYAPEDYERLRAIRAALDPNWLMVASHPIPPATS